MRYFKSENGFTLLELLASVVILVIVLTAFFSFFTQSSLFTKKNEDNLVAMNLAREVLEKVKKDKYNTTFPSTIFDGTDCLSTDKIDIAKGPLELDNDGTFLGINNKLYPCLTFDEESDISPADYKLLRVTVEIYQKAQDASRSDQLLTKAYGYVREQP